jgi:molybdenum cofactor cytidylyltransferase
MKSRILCLILAGGASSRMGGHPKALLPWGKTNVLQHLIRQVKHAGLETCVLVTGAHHDELFPHANPKNLLICRNTEWERGIGSSLSSGIRFLENEFPKTEAVVVLLADQPLVTSEYLAQMLSEYLENPEKIVVSGYGDAAGVPALFPRKYWDSLVKLPPERGAGSFIKSHITHCQVLFPGEILIDIDTPEAYRKALELKDSGQFKKQ